MSTGSGQNGVATPAAPTGATDPGRADVLEQVQRSAVALLTAAGAPPRSLRVQVGDVVVEAEWGRADGPSAAVPPPPTVPEPQDAAPPDPVRTTVTAPTVGVFYRAPEPGAPPFVSEGDVIRVGQQVGIVEVMKLMMPVESDVAGRVVEFLHTDGDSVEFAEPLLVLDPEEV